MTLNNDTQTITPGSALVLTGNGSFRGLGVRVLDVAPDTPDARLLAAISGERREDCILVEPINTDRPDGHGREPFYWFTTSAMLLAQADPGGALLSGLQPGDTVVIEGGPLPDYEGLRCEVVRIEDWGPFLRPLSPRPRGFHLTPFNWTFDAVRKLSAKEAAGHVTPEPVVEEPMAVWERELMGLVDLFTEGLTEALGTPEREPQVGDRVRITDAAGWSEEDYANPSLHGALIPRDQGWDGGSYTDHPYAVRVDDVLGAGPGTFVARSVEVLDTAPVSLEKATDSTFEFPDNTLATIHDEAGLDALPWGSVVQRTDSHIPYVKTSEGWGRLSIFNPTTSYDVTDTLRSDLRIGDVLLLKVYGG